MSEPSSIEACAAAVSADAEFGRCLVAIEPRLRAFVARLPGADVEDVVQEALVRAWRSRAGFDAARGDIAAWSMRIAFRAYVDAGKRRRGGPDGCVVESDVEARAVAPSVDLGDGVDARERLRWLLASLRPIERDVLLRFHQAGESIDRIAAATGVAAGTVKSHLHRARLRLFELQRARERRES